MTLEEEVIKLRHKVEVLLNNDFTLFCLYCNHEFPPRIGEDSPLLGEHMDVCASHPITKLRVENKMLRDKLQVEEAAKKALLSAMSKLNK